MLWFYFPILLVPFTALGWIWYSRHPAPAAWPTYFKRVGILFAIGLFVSSPFLCQQGLGTREAFNYSLSTADAAVQFRTGVFPVLVGQSEYAFNGRIHPLRTAPYIDYFAIALDTITARHLNFWGLQNLTLALSLIGAVFSAYISLRKSTPVSPAWATLLAAGLVLSPGLLAPTYGMDLYMTVMTAPFLPIVLSACVRTLRGETSFKSYALLAAGLAATWLAHPPVALWLTVGVAITQLPVIFTAAFWKRGWLNASTGFLIFLGLSLFAFGSALTVQSYQQTAQARETLSTVQEISRVFRDSLRPVSKEVNLLSDFQLGYAYWIVLIITAALATWRRQRIALIFVAIIALYLALTTPIPGVDPWLWAHVPTAAAKITSVWPMQRLYLLIVVTLIFAAAEVLSFRLEKKKSPAPASLRFVRDFGVLCSLALAAWTISQAWHFIHRGFNTRIDSAQSARLHRPENIDLTVISYAFIGTPPTFVNGVMDPRMEFRLLKRGTAELLNSNWLDKSAELPAVQSGILAAESGEATFLFLGPTLLLKPTTHYRLDLDFKLPELEAILQITGDHAFREYQLPSAGSPEGFGMRPGNLPALTLWTTADKSESVHLQLVGPNLGQSTTLKFAAFELHPLDDRRLPVEVKSWIPLKANVHASEPAYIETPRLYIDGYQAFVNGVEVLTQPSPNQMVMIPIPAGESSIELRYPGILKTRIAFWTSFSAWCAFLGLGTVLVLRPKQPKDSSSTPVSEMVDRSPMAGKYPAAITGAALMIVAIFVAVHYYELHRAIAGPLKIRLVFPRQQTGRSQPLVTTGKPGLGTFIFFRYIDPTHIRVGVDNWGEGWVSEPIAVDYFAEQTFIVYDAALYPEGAKETAGIAAADLDSIKKHITVILNSKVVLDRPFVAYPSKRDEITVGESRIGGSNTEAKFTGQILSVERLPGNEAINPTAK